MPSISHIPSRLVPSTIIFLLCLSLGAPAALPAQSQPFSTQPAPEQTASDRAAPPHSPDGQSAADLPEWAASRNSGFESRARFDERSVCTTCPSASPQGAGPQPKGVPVDSGLPLLLMAGLVYVTWKLKKDSPQTSKDEGENSEETLMS